jgi:hypothetical protein
VRKLRVASFLLPILLSVSCFASGAQKNLSVLFIGNSYTYLPEIGTPEDPGLPKLVAAIAESIDPELHVSVSANTIGGYRLEQHYANPRSVELLKGAYDKVIIQGYSIESLELPPWWKQYGIGVEGFAEFLPKVLDLAFQNNRDVTLYVNWGWNPKHDYFKDSHPGLFFPEGHKRAGEKWCGKDKYDYQRRIDESFEKHTQSYRVKLAHVGDGWLKLQDEGIVTQDEMYISTNSDWSHASLVGAWAAALVLVRDSLGLDIRKTTFVPQGLDAQKAVAIQNSLAD